MAGVNPLVAEKERIALAQYRKFDLQNMTVEDFSQWVTELVLKVQSYNIMRATAYQESKN